MYIYIYICMSPLDVYIYIFSSLREGTSGNGVGDVFRSAADGICGCTYTYAQGR